MRGFGCESRAVRWVAVLSRKTVQTCGIYRSEWRVLIGDVPWGIGYSYEKFGLISLDDSYVTGNM